MVSAKFALILTTRPTVVCSASAQPVPMTTVTDAPRKTHPALLDNSWAGTAVSHADIVAHNVMITLEDALSANTPATKSKTRNADAEKAGKKWVASLVLRKNNKAAPQVNTKVCSAVASLAVITALNALILGVPVPNVSTALMNLMATTAVAHLVSLTLAHHAKQKAAAVQANTKTIEIPANPAVSIVQDALMALVLVKSAIPVMFWVRPVTASQARAAIANTLTVLLETQLAARTPHTAVTDSLSLTPPTHLRSTGVIGAL